jgi:hypothetical protein
MAVRLLLGRLPARPAARVGRRRGARLSRRRHQTGSSARAAARSTPRVHPPLARGDERLRGGRYAKVRGGWTSAWRRRGRGGAPAERPVRHRARPRSRGGHRRPDRPQRQGRQPIGRQHRVQVRPMRRQPQQLCFRAVRGPPRGHRHSQRTRRVQTRHIHRTGDVVHAFESRRHHRQFRPDNPPHQRFTHRETSESSGVEDPLATACGRPLSNREGRRHTRFDYRWPMGTADSRAGVSRAARARRRCR